MYLVFLTMGRIHPTVYYHSVLEKVFSYAIKWKCILFSADHRSEPESSSGSLLICGLLPSTNVGHYNILYSKSGSWIFYYWSAKKKNLSNGKNSCKFVAYLLSFCDSAAYCSTSATKAKSRKYYTQRGAFCAACPSYLPLKQTF